MRLCRLLKKEWKDYWLSSYDVEQLKTRAFDALNDDLNTAVMLSHLFESVKYINSVKQGKETINEQDKNKLKQLFSCLLFDICGLEKSNTQTNSDTNKLDDVMNILLDLRQEAKQNKDYATADKIRNNLQDCGFVIKDSKEGSEWELR